MSSLEAGPFLPMEPQAFGRQMLLEKQAWMEDGGILMF